MGRSEHYKLVPGTQEWRDHQQDVRDEHVPEVANELLSTADGIEEILDEIHFDSNAARAFYSMLTQIDRASELGQFLEVWASRVADRKIP